MGSSEVSSESKQQYGSNNGPLRDVTVIDMTSVVVGPICTRTLADQGANVIKIEPFGGDLLRTMAKGHRNPGMSGKFINFNRNKRSVCLDIKHPDGLSALMELIKRADVFVSNIRPGGLKRAGLDYQTLSTPNPRLIYCSILAFGRGGRYYNSPAYDPIVQSLSGVAGCLERATGEPRFVPMVMTDHISGLIAAQCIGFALFRRERTGQGEEIETPMLENMASFVTSEHLGARTFIPDKGQSGDNRLLSDQYRPQATRDGYITVGPNTNAQAFAFFDAIGRPELKDDPRFSSAAARTENAALYFDVQVQGLVQRTTEEWLDIFAKSDVPAARYNRIDDLLDDPHLKDVAFFQTVTHPSEGELRQTRNPNRFSGGERAHIEPAPRLGEHTREVLHEFGFDNDRITRLVRSGAAMTDAEADP